MKECINNNEVNVIDKSKLISFVREYHDFEKAGDRFLRILNS